LLKYPPLITEPIEKSLFEKKYTSPQKPPIPIQTPPYPKWIETKKTYTFIDIELLMELKSLCVKITLLEYIKYIHVYNKFIKEECLKRPRMKKKDSPIIIVVGFLVELILCRVFFLKYLDTDKYVVNVHINKIMIQNTLINLGESINVM
jgi:hypothetical protein